MLPLSIPFLNGNEWQYIKECLDTNWVSSVGKYVNRFEEMMAEYTGLQHAVAVVNGTAALHLALRVAGVEKGDYVLVNDLTFVGTLNAIEMAGAKPILVDVQEDDWQMDVALVEAFLEKECELNEVGDCMWRNQASRIKAIMPVHVLGNIGEMDQLKQLAEKWKLVCVEDAAEAMGSKRDHQHAGNWGDVACLSFNGNKILTTGGGGMILTNDKDLARQAKHLSTQAKSHATEYEHDAFGYNYRMVNVLAALGVAQLEQLDGFLIKKQQIAQTYLKAFSEHPHIIPQQISPYTQPNNWLNTFRFPQKTHILQSLAKAQIQARPLWKPMHQLPILANAPFLSHSQVSNLLYDSCVSLPSSSDLTESQQEQVIEVVLDGV